MELRSSSLYTAIAMLLLGAVTILVLFFWRITQPTHKNARAEAHPARKAAAQISGAGAAGAIYPLQGSREPSGALSLPDKGIILVVDDEPKAAPGQLGVFAYRVHGQKLQHLPLRLRYPQKRRWDDWEGITSDNQYVVLMASHGKRKGKRARLCRFPITSLQVQAQQVIVTAPLDCVGGKRQRKDIKKLIKRARSSLQFGLPSGWRHLDPKRGGLDIEAIVYAPQEQTYFLGLRGPLAIRGDKSLAIVLEMRWGQGDPTFGVAGLLDLQGRGIRAFTRLADGSVVISAGPMGSRGTFGLYQLKRWPARPFVTHAPRALRYVLPTRGPRLQIEGLAAWQQWLFLFSDSGDWMAGKDAHYLVLPLKKVLRP